jgi:hypothetical protein
MDYLYNLVEDNLIINNIHNVLKNQNFSGMAVTLNNRISGIILCWPKGSRDPVYHSTKYENLYVQMSEIGIFPVRWIIGCLFANEELEKELEDPKQMLLLMLLYRLRERGGRFVETVVSHEFNSFEHLSLGSDVVDCDEEMKKTYLDTFLPPEIFWRKVGFNLIRSLVYHPDTKDHKTITRFEKILLHLPIKMPSFTIENGSISVTEIT